MSEIKVPVDLRNLIDTNQRLLKSLKVQKARADLLLEKYESEIKDELELASNRFLPVFKVLGVYVDQVITGKLNDMEIIKHLESSVKELVIYNRDFLISEEKVRDLEYSFDNMVNKILYLERLVKNNKGVVPEVKNYESEPEPEQEPEPEPEPEPETPKKKMGRPTEEEVWKRNTPPDKSDKIKKHPLLGRMVKPESDAKPSDSRKDFKGFLHKVAEVYDEDTVHDEKLI